MPSPDAEGVWARHASWWQEHFTDGADDEYEEQILPLVARHVRGARRVLEVGCGEGQVARHIARLGCDVLGIDPVLSHVELAVRRGGSPRYIRGRGQQLPLSDGVVDTVVITLVLEHVDPFEPFVTEVARVLEHGGRLVLVLNHPLVQTPGSCWVDDADFAEQYWRLGPYLTEQVVLEEVAPGVTLPFAYRPLSRYVNALGDAGLLVEHLIEPAPAPSTIEHLGGFPEAATIPRLMAIIARRGSTKV